jgi:RNA polymerase sigma-70 factor, ECF subfamily
MNGHLFALHSGHPACRLLSRPDSYGKLFAMEPTERFAAYTDESGMLARMQAGDGDAFAACVRNYCGRLLVAARRILRNEEDANDAVQDAFLSAFKGIGQFQGKSQLGTWLHRIVVNAALGRLRTRQRHPEKSIEDLLPHFCEGEHQIDPPVPWKATPDTALQTEETRDLVQRCIGQLPETYRIVLLLRDIEGLATEETAQALGTTIAVVKTRLHRARQALRTLLDPHFRRGNE